MEKNHVPNHQPVVFKATVGGTPWNWDRWAT